MIEHKVLHGDPVQEIVGLAGDSGANLIVMGTHGRTGLRHVLLGSVAEKVLRTTNCPVLTVRAGLPGKDDREAPPKLQS